MRILRSTVMVRVGGGWAALDEFLEKHDPCRAKGRTNLELRDSILRPSGAIDEMHSFKEGRRSTPRKSIGNNSTIRTPPQPVAFSTPRYAGTPGPITKVCCLKYGH